MEELLVRIIKLIISVFESAQAGDKESLQKLEELKSFLPEDLRTELVAKLQDKVDEAKFGERS